jgi:hypothetical protein
MKPDHISEDYANAFSYLDHGRALYHPVSSKKLGPNSLGYFDAYGKWVSILSLEDDVQLSSARLSEPVVPASRLEPRNSTWLDPLRPSSVSKVNVSVNVSDDLR